MNRKIAGLPNGLVRLWRRVGCFVKMKENVQLADMTNDLFALVCKCGVTRRLKILIDHSYRSVQRYLTYSLNI